MADGRESGSALPVIVQARARGAGTATDRDRAERMSRRGLGREAMDGGADAFHADVAAVDREGRGGRPRAGLALTARHPPRIALGRYGTPRHRQGPRR